MGAAACFVLALCVAASAAGTGYRRAHLVPVQLAAAAGGEAAQVKHIFGGRCMEHGAWGYCDGGISAGCLSHNQAGCACCCGSTPTPTIPPVRPNFGPQS